MGALDGLEPREVFEWFARICAIPHGSGNTRQISDFLAEFARERGLEYMQDALNNVIIIREASPGYEAAEPVILQGHMDMVCEAAPDCARDMATQGLELAVEGDTVFARGTTLGGDDGIAVAMMLAVLSGALPHPRVEAVFTVDEEIGMLGAQGIDLHMLRGRRMINIDSEEEGVFTAGCAGGRSVRCILPITRAAARGTLLTIEVGGLKGGHSGTEIHRGRANAVRLLGRTLSTLERERGTALRICSVFGGKKDNAIPNCAEAVTVVADTQMAERVCADMTAAFRAEFAGVDNGVFVRCAPYAGETLLPMDAASMARVVALLMCAPGGVQAMSGEIPGLVLTSLNLGILETTAVEVSAIFCVRSGLESGKALLTDGLERLTALLGGRTEISGDYPGWAYRSDSPLRTLLAAVFQEQCGHAPRVEAIHAGVECGLFAGKLPGLDCVSIGPDLTDIHTARERMHIASVGRTWALLCETLRRMR
ncbi:MAG: aminoacyl-histidine dipeptidase [Oscillospiraceae bacterium]|nr:aminoacyl-histidine dipeptidase [Oscillospiraceae bacterium]